MKIGYPDYGWGIPRKIKFWISRFLASFRNQDAAIYIAFKNTPLFQSLSEDQVWQVAKAAQRVTYKTGDLILKQGDIGDKLYYIEKGAIRIYVTNPQDNTEIVLARLEAGDYFGEQALLEEAPQKRIATAKALTNCDLYAVSHADYLRVLNPELIKILKKVGEKELFEIFGQTQEIFGSLKKEVLKDFAGKIFNYSDGNVIFKIGDSADYAYFVLSGNVEIEIPYEKGVTKTLLGNGCLFGELAVLNKTKRAGTATAKGDLTVLAYDIEMFHKLCAASPELRHCISLLKNVYLTKHGGVVNIYYGKFLNTNAVTAVYNLENGSIVTAVRAMGSLIFMMTYNGVKEAKELHYARGSEIRRKLTIKDQKIVGVLSFGEWRELNEICNLILKATPITDEQIQSFLSSGDLGIKKLTILEEEKQEILCSCMHITKGQIYEEIQKGSNKVDDLVQKTGAGSVCGTCRPKIVELLGLKAWTTVKLIKKTPLHPNICSFKFQPLECQKIDYKPGQYTVISAFIDQHFISRTYTLTSLASQDPFIEIIVKKEPKGCFSQWLFNQANESSLFRISDPQGHFTPNADENVPMVCFVGGIGITPAIAYARYVAQTNRRRLHIDYSAPLQSDFILRDELTNASKNITIHFRSTREAGRIQNDHIKQTIRDFPNAVYYICGPKPFEQLIVSYLTKEQIPVSRIKIEQFIHAGSPLNLSQ